jgi:hypothetical protein
MDRKGRWLDNLFIERLWRSVKYEEVCPTVWLRRELELEATLPPTTAKGLTRRSDA